MAEDQQQSQATLNDVFSTGETSGTETQQASRNDEDHSVFSELVGEGKPFKDAEALARGKLESNRFIEQLKDENKKMREALHELEEKANRNIALSDILEEIRNGASQQGTEDNQPRITEADITKLVDKTLENKQREAQAQTNREYVSTTITEAFNGDEAKAAEYIKAKAKELGLGTQTLSLMRDTSPKALLTLLGITPKGGREQTQSVTSVNFDRAVNTDHPNFMGGKKNYSYYQKLRKEMGVAKFYSNTNLLNEMYAEADKQGDAFYQ